MMFLGLRKYKVFLMCVLFICNISALYADEDEKWIFSSTQFDSNMEGDEIATLIPQYILQNFPQSLMRSVSIEEQYRLDVQALDDSIREFYEDLQSKTYERDILLFSQDESNTVLEKQKKIEEEIETLKQEIENANSDKRALEQKSYEIVEKEINLFNDSVDLYALSNTSDFFEPRDVDALITGSIIHTDDFVFVTVYLTLYPGKVVILELQELDTITSIQSMSKRIAEKIYTALTSKNEISIAFSILPQEAQENAIIHINGQLLEFEENEENAQVTLTEGLYEFYIESPGYEGLAVNYNFFESEYLVKINLKPIDVSNVSFSIPSPNGTIFLNTQKMLQETMADNPTLDDNTTQGIVSVNGFPALGEFVSEDGNTTWFLLNEGLDRPLSDPNYSFTFEPETKNYAEIIENNRKRMYNSYAALIVSLPLYFIANGQYINEYNSWASGNSAGENVAGWEIARNITMGASIGLGVNFLVQLGLYIYSANAILPEEVSTNN